MAIDLRASALDITGYPGNAHTITLTWPAGTLVGTTWAATIAGEAIDSVTVDGDDLVLELTIPAAVGTSELVLTQTDVTPDAVKATGTVRSTETATRDPDATNLTVTLSTAEGTVTIVGTGPEGPAGDTGPAGSDATVNTANVTAAGAVMTTGAQSVAGVKTFSSSPVVPDGAASGDAVNKGQLDALGGTTGLVPIARQVVGVGGAASVDFQNISQDYEDLIIRGVARGNTSAAIIGVNCRLNNDTGTNYTLAYIYNGAGTVSGGAAISQSSEPIGNIAAATAPVGGAGMFETRIGSYARTAFFKQFVSTMSDYRGATTAGQVAQLVGGTWTSTAAVNRITLFPGAGSFVEGSVFTLYGVSSVPS